MTRNKMTDLNDHLFAQLERLSDEELSAEALEAEIKRAKAVSGIAQQVIANADLGLRAAEFEDRKLDADLRLPPMLGAAVRRKTPEEVAWLLENAPRHAEGEALRLFAERFGWAPSKASLASWMHDRGVKPTSKHQRRCRACIDAGRERL